MAVLQLTFRNVSLGKWSKNWSGYRRYKGLFYIWSMMTRSIHEWWHVRTNKCVRTNICKKSVFAVSVKNINICGRILTQFTGLLLTNTIAAKRHLLAERTALGKSVSVSLRNAGRRTNFWDKKSSDFSGEIFQKRNYCPRTAFSGSNSFSILSHPVMSWYGSRATAREQLSRAVILSRF